MTASIRINGSPTPVEDIQIGDTVTLSNFDDTGVLTWSWQLTSKPAGSTAVLSSTTNPTSSFVADLEGSYRIRLTTDSSDVDLAVGRILSTHTGVKLLARDEIEEGDASLVEGWALPMRDSMQLFDKRIGLTTRKTVYFEGTTTVGPKLLKVTGSIALPNGDYVPTVDLADVVAGYGALVFFDDSGALTQNTKVSVVEHGLTELIADPDTLVADDPVYMDAVAGNLTKTQGSANAILVGYCAEVSGGNRRIWFAPGFKVTGGGGGLTGAGAANKIAYWDAASNLTYNANLHWDNGSGFLGIGTPTPNTALHVMGDTTFEGSGQTIIVQPGALDPLIVSASTLAVGTNSIVQWLFDAAGNLEAQNSGQIKSIGAPTDTNDAVTYDYDQRSHSAATNHAVNGALNFWQRGTSFPFTGAGRSYCADRWCVASDNAGADVTVAQDTDSLAGRYSLKLTVNVGDNLLGSRGIIQEIDREMVYKLRGRTLKVKFLAKLDLIAPGSVVVYVVAGTGAENENVVSGYTGPSYVIAPTDLGTGIPAGWNYMTVNSGVNIVPTNATTLALAIGLDVTTGVTTNSARFTDIQLSAESDIDFGDMPFVHAGGSIEGDFALCQKYYEKSYGITVDPASITDNNSVHLGIMTTGGADRYTPSIRYNTRKTGPITPVVILYGPTTGATGQVYSGGADRAATVIHDGDAGFGIEDTSTTTTPGDWAYVHFTADADI